MTVDNIHDTTMTNTNPASTKQYYFIDLDTYSRQIVSWDSAPKDEIDFLLGNGLHRVFLSKGQFNKLVKELENARS